MSEHRFFLLMGVPVPAFFLLLLVFQLFFMPGLLRKGGNLYVPFKHIVVGGSPNNPPYEFLDENNEPAGYIVDLTRAIASEMTVEVEIRLGDRKEILEDFDKGKIDLLQGITETEPVVGNNPFLSHATYSQKLFAAADSPQKITSLDQLQEGSLFLSKNTPFLDHLIKKYPAIHFHPVASHAAALRRLAEGMADYALIVNLPGPYLNRELGFLKQSMGENKKIVQVGELQNNLGYGYLTHDNAPQMLTHIKTCLQNLEQSGRYKEIQEQWLGRTVPTALSKRDRTVQLGGLIFSPLLLIVCTVFFWNHSLKKEVDRRTSELAVQQLQLIQADKMTSLGILVAGVAHEINNPTGLILHNLATLKRVYENADAVLEKRYETEGDFFIKGLPYSILREESPHIFAEIQNGAERIRQIVEDLKDFARKDSMVLTEKTSLNKVVLSSVRLLESSLGRQTPRIDVKLTESLPAFQGNSSRIQQVVINLLLNASQASLDKEQTISIRTDLDQEKNQIVLEIKDQGIGISPENLSFLCDPFYTTKREKGGTGLGLSISERIVKEHKGQLQFASKVNIGTTVTMLLPIYIQENNHA